MRLAGASKWYVGAALASVLVLVAGWFLLVSPQRSSADEINLAAEEMAAANVATQRQINTLKAQYKDLPALEQRLAEVRSRIPANASMPSLVRSVSTKATTSGVALQSLVPSTPSPLEDNGSGDLSAPGQVNVYPVSVVVEGKFANLRLFLVSLEKLQRSFMVTGLEISRVEDSTKAAGTLTATVTGRVFTANPGTPVVAKPNSATSTDASAETSES